MKTVTLAIVAGFLAGFFPGICYYVAGTIRWGWDWLWQDTSSPWRTS